MSLKKSFVLGPNYFALETMENTLRAEAPRGQGMGLVYSPPGRGKTEATEFRYGQSSIFYIRVRRVWGVRDLLEAICEELRIEPEYRTVRRFDQVCRELRRRGEPLYVDEADYLLHNVALLDVLRDLHDIAKTPIVLIGMENICGKLQKYEQFWSRVLPAAIVEFKPLSPAEMALIAQDWAGLDLKPDAAEALCRHVEGDFRLWVGCLLELDRVCGTNKTNEVSLNLAETVIKRLSAKKQLAGRSLEDFKKIRVVGRVMA